MARLPSLKQPCFAWEQLLESKSPTYNNLSQLRLRPIHLNQGYQHDLVYMRINRIMHVYNLFVCQYPFFRKTGIYLKYPPCVWVLMGLQKAGER